MDSCLTVAKVFPDFELALLHCTYGQRTQHRELRSFHAIADHYKVQHRMVVSMDHLTRIGHSSLTDERIPVSTANLNSTAIPTSYVPFRNANILAVAVSWAEVIGATAIAVGAVEEDSSGYPDCRKEFYTAFEEVIRTGTKPETRMRILTPVIDLSKAEIVLQGQAINAPFHLTWSCYQRDDVACGVCDSCALRLRGFARAGVEDPIPYAQRPTYAQ
jgi:7-cyano-7-deazaguanine synthase